MQSLNQFADYISRAEELSAEIASIYRTCTGFESQQVEGSGSLPERRFIRVKQAIIEAAVAHGCVFLTSMILHNVATSPDEARRNEINRLCLHFQYCLKIAGDFGLVLIDQFDDKKIDSHLREKFLIGATKLPYPPHEVRFTQILGFHYAGIGQSHFGSLVDIVLGSFRFAINAFTRGQTGQLATAAKMLGMISPMFYRLQNGKVSELSLFFSPKIIKAPTYLKKYAGCNRFRHPVHCYGATQRKVLPPLICLQTRGSQYHPRGRRVSLGSLEQRA